MFYIKSIVLAIFRSLLTFLNLYHHEITKNLVYIVLYGAVELAIITAFAILYSTLSTPTLSAVFTVLTFIIGRMNEDIMRFAWRLEEKGLTTIAAQTKYWLARGAAHITPNLHLFNKRSLAVYDESVVTDWWAIIYAIVYIAAIMTVATMVFKKKDFK